MDKKTRTTKVKHSSDDVTTINVTTSRKHTYIWVDGAKFEVSYHEESGRLSLSVYGRQIKEVEFCSAKENPIVFTEKRF